MISRRGKQRNSAADNLCKLSVAAFNVALRIGARSDSRLALSVLGPTPRHGDDLRGNRASVQGLCEAQHPGEIDPEISFGSASNGSTELNVQAGFSVGSSIGRNGTNVVNADGRLSHLLVKQRHIRGQIRIVVLELNHCNRGISSCSRSVLGNSVEQSQKLRDDFLSVGIGLASLNMGGQKNQNVPQK